MVMREPARGEDNSCRDKAIKSIQDIIDKLPLDQTEEERYHALQRIFEFTAANAQRCADNFEPENFIARNIIQNYSHDNRVCMLEAIEGSAHRLEVVEREMAKSSLCRINGTATAFAKCSEQKQILFDILGSVHEVNQQGPYSIGNIDDDRYAPSPSYIRDLQQKLVLLLNYIGGIVLVFEEVLAA